MLSLTSSLNFTQLRQQGFLTAKELYNKFSDRFFYPYANYLKRQLFIPEQDDFIALLLSILHGSANSRIYDSLYLISTSIDFDAEPSKTYYEPVAYDGRFAWLIEYNPKDNTLNVEIYQPSTNADYSAVTLELTKNLLALGSLLGASDVRALLASTPTTEIEAK